MHGINAETDAQYVQTAVMGYVLPRLYLSHFYDAGEADKHTHMMDQTRYKGYARRSMEHA